MTQPDPTDDAASSPEPASPEETPLPKTAQSLADEARDLKALKSSVVEAATISGTLWVSYLFVLFYLAVAAGAVSHKDLFFERGVKLPFLGIDLPLTAFFAMGPALFLIVHAYVLVHFVLLARKVGLFHHELETQISGSQDLSDVRASLRRQMPSNIFIQFLAGPRDVRQGGLGWLLRLIAWISLVFGPVLLMVFFQLRFLPYHHPAITWWHRFAVLIDIGLLWWLWPAIALATLDGRALSRRETRVSQAIRACGAIPVLLVFCIATFPGEWLHTALPSIRFIPRDVAASVSGVWLKRDIGSLHDVLLDGAIDEVARRPTSPFANVLVLPGLDAAEPAKVDAEENPSGFRESISLRGRHLEGAVMVGARMPRADLTGAFLRDAVLREADLRDARFGCGNRERTGNFAPSDPANCAQMQGIELAFARLDRARMEGAQLTGARLSGASLRDAELDYAVVDEAMFDGAALAGAKLTYMSGTRARFDRANLRGAQLHDSDLRLAVFDGAKMTGVTLGGAKLHGASFQATDLRGASFHNAWAQGANFLDADLSGASLVETRLHAAGLKQARLDGAIIRDICAWRADPGQLNGTSLIRVERVSTIPRPEDRPTGGKDDCGWGVPAFQELQTVGGFASANDLPTEYLKRLDPARAFPEETAMAEAWRRLASNPADETAVANKRAEVWKAIGCDANHGLVTMRSLWSQLWDFRSEAWTRTIAAMFLDPAGCPATSQLTDKDKARFDALRQGVAPPE